MVASDYANAAAVVVLIACVVERSHFLPLLIATSVPVVESGTAIPLAKVRASFKVRFTNALLFWSTLYLAKLSLLLLYRSLFAVSRRFTRAWWITTVFTALAWGVHVLDTLWLCGAPSDLFTGA